MSLILTMYHHIFDFFLTVAQIYFKFYVDVPSVDSYKVCNNRGAIPIFHYGKLWEILCNYRPVLTKSSSIKPLTKNHSYLVWRISRGSSFKFVQIRLLYN